MAGSIEGSITFETHDQADKARLLALQAIENATGPIPTDVGATPDRVGPGAAYDQ